ncbi:TrmH family RNA methyltransferase [Paenalcaligenes niemegkensis]|uniref:TrmH family RNA methyltransferase n=1 Tax=Paenalcaligenes niemegkensis TaxID=2895469 RepID=UPI0027E350C9|nr:RNA methyltransferase [Paenalcaligenes niemegkensis]
MSSALLRSLSKVEQPQGIAFAVSMPTQSPDGPLDGAALLLDRIQDPGNLGTLLRTAAAADIGQVFLSEGCADVWSQKVLRSAQGAHFNLSLYEQVDLHHLIRHSKVQVFATSLDDAQSLYQIRIPSSAAWVFGNEGQGVEAALQQKATARVFIPQSARVESLNVAIAAGICLFEQRRQSLA